MNLLQVALSQYGITEIKGKKDNPRIIKYFTECNWPGEKLKDETAWCSAFINWCAMKAGLERSGELTARSWLGVGKSIANPEPGDIVVFWRIDRNDWRGHVGIYCRSNESSIFTLGGNQDNQVNIKPYSIYGKNTGLLDYRRLDKAL